MRIARLEPGAEADAKVDAHKAVMLAKIRCLGPILPIAPGPVQPMVTGPVVPITTPVTPIVTEPVTRPADWSGTDPTGSADSTDQADCTDCQSGTDPATGTRRRHD